MKKVFVGMSGGVDSSVSAAILKNQGYEVIGVFIRVWEPPNFNCTWRDDRRDAMRVAAVLNIPFLTIDLSKEYKSEVVDYMISEYELGRTPNPDIMCNKYIKFGSFFDWAMEQGANYVATGHYARVLKNDEGEAKLLAGLDRNKDQSYFLWAVSQNQLQKTIFPIGEFEKDKVREMAREFNLPTADKKDSQGLCFIGKLDIKEFLKEFIEEKSGDVLNEAGEKIGTHNGAVFFTIGERHGFQVKTKDDNTKPYFITAKNIENNTITVSQNLLKSKNQTKNIVLTETNWISDKPEASKNYSARFRYRQELVKVELENKDNNWQVKFNRSQLIPAGQSLVVYNDDECLGGGIIK